MGRSGSMGHGSFEFEYFNLDWTLSTIRQTAVQDAVRDAVRDVVRDVVQDAIRCET